MQLGLWGGMGEADERAGRVLARVQGMLGPDRVLTAVLGGGRDPGDQVRLVPWGDERVPATARPSRPGRAGCRRRPRRPCCPRRYRPR